VPLPGWCIFRQRPDGGFGCRQREARQQGRPGAAELGQGQASAPVLDRQGNPIDGQMWVPKSTSERLARTWGAIVQGVKLWRRVPLRKAT